MAERQRWRMTLQELMHRASARPSELEEWARAGALGPRWQETTENKWRHVTKDCANRAIATRALLDSGIDLATAAELAGPAAERLAAGQPVSFRVGPATVTLDPRDVRTE